MPKLTFKSFTLNIVIIKNTLILRQQPIYYKRSVKSIISLLITVLYTILRRCFYQIRNGGGFTKNLIKIRIKKTGLIIILRI